MVGRLLAVALAALGLLLLGGSQLGGFEEAQEALLRWTSSPVARLHQPAEPEAGAKLIAKEVKEEATVAVAKPAFLQKQEEPKPEEPQQDEMTRRCERMRPIVMCHRACGRDHACHVACPKPGCAHMAGKVEAVLKCHGACQPGDRACHHACPRPFLHFAQRCMGAMEERLHANCSGLEPVMKCHGSCGRDHECHVKCPRPQCPNLRAEVEATLKCHGFCRDDRECHHRCPNPMWRMARQCDRSLEEMKCLKLCSPGDDECRKACSEPFGRGHHGEHHHGEHHHGHHHGHFGGLFRHRHHGHHGHHEGTEEIEVEPIWWHRMLASHA